MGLDSVLISTSNEHFSATGLVQHKLYVLLTELRLWLYPNPFCLHSILSLFVLSKRLDLQWCWNTFQGLGYYGCPVLIKPISQKDAVNPSRK